MKLEHGKRVIVVKEKIISNFTEKNWQDIGLLTECCDLINSHPRLLRSLSWGDGDYSGNVADILRAIVGRNVSYLTTLEEYLSEKFEYETHYISAKPSQNKMTFSPIVFDTPDTNIENDLAAIMMPISVETTTTFQAIKQSCNSCQLRAVRADEMWEDSTIIQDIFNLICKSSVVIVDFTNKNSNVMYETGIAHTLGKLVIPIAQSIDDIPFDMRHHRVLTYHSNNEGLQALQNSLTDKLKQINV